MSVVSDITIAIGSQKRREGGEKGERKGREVFLMRVCD